MIFPFDRSKHMARRKGFVTCEGDQNTIAPARKATAAIIPVLGLQLLMKSMSGLSVGVLYT
jgi:hypothetical protein